MVNLKFAENALLKTSKTQEISTNSRIFLFVSRNVWFPKIISAQPDTIQNTQKPSWQRPGSFP